MDVPLLSCTKTPEQGYKKKGNGATKNRNEGTFAKTALLQSRAFVSSRILTEGMSSIFQRENLLKLRTLKVANLNLRVLKDLTAQF